MIEHNKQSGRTTRMIEEAKVLWAAGRAVYVIFASRHQAVYWKQLLRKDHPGLSIEHYEMFKEGDIKELRVRTAWPNCVFLFDHYLLQSEIAALLAPYKKAMIEIHRWDSSDFPFHGPIIKDVHNSAAIAAVDVARALGRADDEAVTTIAHALNHYHLQRTQENIGEQITGALHQVLDTLADIRGEAMNELGRDEEDTGAWVANSRYDESYVDGMNSMIEELEKKLK